MLLIFAIAHNNNTNEGTIAKNNKVCSIADLMEEKLTLALSKDFLTQESVYT